MYKPLHWSASIAIAVLILFTSCSSTEKPPQKLNSDLIELNDVRATFASKGKAFSTEEKGMQKIILTQHKAITAHTEIVQHTLNTIVPLEKDSPIRLNILNANGVVLKSSLETAKKGLNEYQLNFEDYEVGLYYIVLISDEVYRRFCVAKIQ